MVHRDKHVFTHVSGHAKIIFMMISKTFISLTQDQIAQNKLK